MQREKIMGWMYLAVGICGICILVSLCVHDPDDIDGARADRAAIFATFRQILFSVCLIGVTVYGFCRWALAKKPKVTAAKTSTPIPVPTDHWTLEDERGELRRRILAAINNFGTEQEEFKKLGFEAQAFDQRYLLAHSEIFSEEMVNSVSLDRVLMDHLWGAYANKYNPTK